MKEDPSVAPFHRLEVSPSPNNPIGVRTMNVQRTLRKMMMDGNILVQVFPNWRESGKPPLVIFQDPHLSRSVDIKFNARHLPEEINKVLPSEYQLPIRRVHSSISTAGLCRNRRKNMPVWYVISHKDL